ncbi:MULTISPECIES: hypothetical protein [unclassified Streptomyces]|uniref:hypothetical protein n=1 Tax=unclassified Streptomyces TaxID=2593676 RepID=UPI0036557048
MLDVGPKEFLSIAGQRLPARYERALSRYRYGPGAAKADFLVSEPIPWADPLVRQESATAAGECVDEPFVLVVDPAVTDPSRIP